MDVAEHIISLERAALDRWITADPDGYLSLYSRDATYFDPFTEKRVDGLEELNARVATMRGMTLPFTEPRYEMNNPVVHVEGNVAVLTFNLVNYGKPSGSAEETILARWNATEVIHTHRSITQPKLAGPVDHWFPCPSHHEEVSMSPKKGTQKSKSTAKKTTKESSKSTTASGKSSKGFTDEERAAMKERAQELKAEARWNKSKADGERDLLAKIAEMPGPDRAMAKQLHAIMKASAPALSPRTWYGMPAYANKDGKVVCYFTPASKFKSRYATFGFNDDANLDEGTMWPTSFALKKLTAAEEARIGALVKKAVS